MNIDKKSTIEFSPAADLARNRDHPYRKEQLTKSNRRSMPIGSKSTAAAKKEGGGGQEGGAEEDEGKFLSPIAPGAASSSNSGQVSEIPKVDTLRFKPIKTLASRIDGTEYCEEASIEKVLEMLEMGCIDEAISYADTLYANFVSPDNLDIVALADYVKVLTILRQWRRITSLLCTKKLYQIHIVFAYYTVVALFHRKQYEEVTELTIGHVIPNSAAYNLPLRSPSQVTGRHVEEDRMKFSFATMTELDSVARKLRMAPALLLSIAECYLKLMNRDAAMVCIHYAVSHDNTPTHCERLMTKYNLVEPADWEKYKTIRKSQLDLYEGSFDPKVLIEKAHNAYEMGRFVEAKRLTDVVFEHFGPHHECMLLRIHCMTLLGESRGLLELGQQLVADDPHVPLPWYCVALYYYTIGANSKARSFISKCTMMDTTFAEAWVAFGHILHYEIEHEQSMSCYYRASKLVDRSSEPFLYVALQYSTHSQRLSKKFMSEAVARAPKDPLIRHEEACIAYTAKQYDEADRIFMEVLFMVTESEPGTNIRVVLRKPIDDFWRPMINNMGHIARKRNKFELAIMFHERAVRMEPKFVDAIASIAICYAVTGRVNEATAFFNRALAIDPFNEVIRQCMSKMIMAEKEIFDLDVAVDVSRIDLNQVEHQRPLTHAQLRKPFNDAHVIPKNPECNEPLATIGGQEPSTSDQPEQMEDVVEGGVLEEGGGEGENNDNDEEM